MAGLHGVGPDRSLHELKVVDPACVHTQPVDLMRTSIERKDHLVSGFHTDKTRWIAEDLKQML